MLIAGLCASEADAAGPVEVRTLAPIEAGRWWTVNDDVMGGRSRGAFSVLAGILSFEGALDNVGGGFASVRSLAEPANLDGFTGVRLVVRGDGRRYRVRLTTAETRTARVAPAFWADFDTRASPRDAWQVVEIPFDRFTLRWRGRRVQGPPLKTDAVGGLGLMIADRKDAPFRLEVARIEAYRPAPQLSAYAWSARPLVVVADGPGDPRLLRQLARVATHRAGFDERQMALVVVDRAGPASSALRTAVEAPGEGFAVRLVGKDGGVKAATAEAASLRELFARIDAMPMRQAEVQAAEQR
jgi:monofunctional biosynthetic peptidoglycan transglycosylase